jgi:poly-gamma-glutamate synthesis protein (capsule biosynthesis protein)
MRAFFGSFFSVFFYSVVAFSLVLFFVLLLIPRSSSRVLPAESQVIVIPSTTPEEIEVVVAGDVMLGRTVEIKSAELRDWTYPFRKVGDRLMVADIVVVNLENPIIEDCPSHSEGFKFCATPKMLEGLSFSGVDVVSLANNHALNYGEKGLEETEAHLAQKGIASTDPGKLVILKREGVLFGFLGLNLTTRDLNEKDLAFIRESDSKVDVLIMGVHWGAEYTRTPTEPQKAWARQMVLAGVDVIAGHHSHWVQTSEVIDGKPVYYSLGNLVFDQMWSEETKKGLILALYHKGNELDSIEELPTFMSSWAQPEFMPVQKAE